MRPKTIYQTYLIIGISILILTISCSKIIHPDPDQRLTYTYINTFSESIGIEIYNLSKQSSSKYTVLPLDSVSFLQENELQPFQGCLQNDCSNIGDSVVIRFKDRCTSYKFNSSNVDSIGNGVFSLNEYDNYSSDIRNHLTYELFYSIDSIDYKNGLPCN